MGTRTLAELVPHKFLTEGQLRILTAGRAFLWRIRFGLHLLTGRREDRLLFDHQVKLAQMLGYEDASFTLAVEQLMQRYYRTVMELSRLNEMLLQLFEEAILLDKNEPPLPLGPRFQSRNGYLEVADDQVFARDPSALLEMFLLLEQNLDLRGVNARTIALVKQHLWLIDEEFRQNPRHHRLFLDILRAPQGVTRTLKRMNTYGVLGLYIPAFGRIVGRMQYDLFHAYTVDAHTLFVVENLRRFALPRFDNEFPSCSTVMQRLEKPEVAYLAGLFHDIAKGRGGDHSELGAVDAEAFCLEHGMSRYDARLVAWLVQHHLLLSLTAQKKDLNDPNVVNEFARTVGDQTHLDYLYVLTVADVRGTNPKIWNSWKESLFAELYHSTRRALRRGVSNPIDKDEFITGRQSASRAAAFAGRPRALELPSRSGAASPRSISCATGPRRSRGTRACSSRARAPARSPSTSTTSWCRASRRSPCIRPKRLARSCARPPCSTSSASRSSTRASCRSRSRASTPTACSRATAARSASAAGSTRSGTACSKR